MVSTVVNLTQARHHTPLEGSYPSYPTEKENRLLSSSQLLTPALWQDMDYSSALTSITQSVLALLSALGQRHSKCLLVHHSWGCKTWSSFLRPHAARDLQDDEQHLGNSRLFKEWYIECFSKFLIACIYLFYICMHCHSCVYAKAWIWLQSPRVEISFLFLPWGLQGSNADF